LCCVDGNIAPSIASVSSSRRAASLYRQMSTVGERAPTSVPGTALEAGDQGGYFNEQLTPQQLGAMGEYKDTSSFLKLVSQLEF